MSKDRFLDAQTLWPTLRHLAQKSRGPTWIAAPYLGEGGAGLLHLGGGDRLVVALTPSNSRAGSVCPAEIRKLQRRGVQVFINANLHAKVYLVGSTAVVCSANLSQRSAVLDEAGLLTKDAKVVEKIKEWFAERWDEPVTPTWLEICEKMYKSPRLSDDKAHDGSHTRTWLIGTEPREFFPKHERAAAEQGEADSEARLSDRKRFEVDAIRWTGTDSFIRDAKQGEQVIVVHEGKVYPPARLLNLKRVRSKGEQVRYVYLESHKRPQTVRFGLFRAALARVGLKLGNSVSARAIKSESALKRARSLLQQE
jgi:PLD-like domain